MARGAQPPGSPMTVALSRTLKVQDWLELPPPGAGMVVHDVHGEADQ